MIHIYKLHIITYVVGTSFSIVVEIEHVIFYYNHCIKYDLLKCIVCSINLQVNGLVSLGTMNLNKRRLIFCTFIYSCAAIGLIGAGLGSKRWVVASARRTSNTTESVGQVNLGLFYGDKYLNIGYGLRTYSVDGK